MKNITTISDELRELTDINVVMGTLEEIAAVNMQRIRNAVLNNRSWTEELHTVFSEVTTAYEEKIFKIKKRRKDTNGKSILVFLSANTGLYGTVVINTFTEFLNAAKLNTAADLLVIGRMGKSLMESALPNRECIVTEFSDNGIDTAQLQKIIILLRRYEHVSVFHSKFKNLLTQTVTETMISGDVSPTQSAEDISAATYIFEPSLEELIHFFQTEIFASLLEQVFHESRLSKLAARMVFLHGATLHLEELAQKISLERNILRHQIINKKLLESTQLSRSYLRR